MDAVVVGGHFIVMIPMDDSFLNFVFVKAYTADHFLPLYFIFVELEDIIWVLFLNLISVAIMLFFFWVLVYFRIFHLLISHLILSALGGANGLV